MGKYHVGRGFISGAIYAGTLPGDKIRGLDRSIVTDEAIMAVCDHMIDMAYGEHRDTYEYEWRMKDGGKVTLMVKIEEGSKDDK